jgi:hypothetical protein
MTKSTSLICFVMLLLIGVPVAFAENEPGADFVMANQPSGEPYDWRKTRLPEKPWRRLYHEIITTKLLLCILNAETAP